MVPHSKFRRDSFATYRYVEKVTVGFGTNKLLSNFVESLVAFWMVSVGVAVVCRVSLLDDGRSG
jgi:hypothetical protein